MYNRLHFFCAALLLAPGGAFGGDLVFRSGPERVHLLELYTSEGCSSCPPAEERFSALKANAGLWKEVVPVAFHVDYWDSLGWPDRFASPAYTQRQQGYAREWGNGSIYTPQFVLDGQESGAADIPAGSGPGGNLILNLNSARALTVQYQPATPAPGLIWEAHIVLLGAGLSTEVRAGENGGRRLRHDFVALELLSLPLRAGTNAGRLTLPPRKDGEKAIAAWITRADQSTPLQAAGGWE